MIMFVTISQEEDGVDDEEEVEKSSIQLLDYVE